MTRSHAHRLVTPLVALAICSAHATARSEPPASSSQTAANAARQHCAHHASPAPSAPLPGQSLYNLKLSLTDQHGTSLGLAAFRGQPVLIAMFYSACTTVCPMLIEQMKQLDASLAPEVRAQTRLVLVSLDPEHDDVARLAELAASHGIRDERWHFTRTPEASVREVAALLGVRYQRASDGSISHSPLIAVLDRDGVLVTRFAGGPLAAGEASRALSRSLGPVR